MIRVGDRRRAGYVCSNSQTMHQFGDDSIELRQRVRHQLCAKPRGPKPLDAAIHLRAELVADAGAHGDNFSGRPLRASLARRSSSLRVDGLKSSQGLFLDAVRHRTDEQFAADAKRRFGAIEVSPLFFRSLNEVVSVNWWKSI